MSDVDTNLDGNDMNLTQENDGGKASRKVMGMIDYVNFAGQMTSIGPFRNQDDTERKLIRIFKCYTKVGGQAKAKRQKTRWGIKDTYQEFFTSKIVDYAKSLNGSRETKAKNIEAFVATLPDPLKLINPAWRIKSFDPHLHTPVEVLHVVLLGFIKHFWRDAMKRVNDSSKTLLITRLSSVNISGLGCSKISSKTLVQYSGSLTGRDFCIIVQVAPFVLYDLVPLECFKAWLALSILVPLIWQPEITNLDRHIVSSKLKVDFRCY